MANSSTDLSTTIASWTRKLSLPLLLLSFLGNSAWGASVKTAEIAAGSPSVDEDRVTIRIKVQDQNDRPVTELDETNFQLLVDGKPLAFRNKDWKSPEEAVPPPAWIIVLLDMSGSMQEKDSRGTTKLIGAIDAIKAFKETLSQRIANAPTPNVPQIAIVPFGKAGTNCSGFPVEQSNLDKFFPVDDFKLNSHLDFLAQQKPCAATNLYEPLSKAIRFLGNEADTRFYPSEDSKQPQPRLSIILLSDGYHTESKEEEDFKALTSLLRRNEQITTHTLGYGLTPEELGKEYGLSHPATRQDLWSGDRSQLPKGKVPAEAFVDQERLEEIADLTGGISEFSGDAVSIAGKLELFLNALLGEFEISYIQPNADRGSKHTVRVIVTPPEGNPVESDSKTYAIRGPRLLSPGIRFSILLFTLLAMAGGGAVPFWIWANSLKQET